jgi:hypothetical protein
MIRIVISVILLIGIIAGVYLVSNRTQLFPKASTQEQNIDFPQDVIITNITEKSFTMSYFTPNQKVPTAIKYSQDPTNLSQTKTDDRDKENNKGDWYSHYVTLTDLEPNTDYFIQIETFGTKLKHDFIIQKTASIIAVQLPPAKSFTGQIQRTPRFGWIDTLIYMRTEQGQLLSTRPDSSGNWTFDLARYRTKNLDNYYQVLDIDMVDIVGIVGNDGVAHLKIYAYGLAKPTLLHLGIVKVPFYGIELGSSEQGTAESSASAEESRGNGGIIESIWFFITSWFGWD